MEKNNTSSNSSFSICKKIRQALATNPTFKAIHRMKQYYQEPRPQNIKAVNNGGGGGTIPIMFDHSIPTSIGNNGNSSISVVSKVVPIPHVGISERKGKVVTKEGKLHPTNIETRGPLKEHHGIGVVNLEQQGKKSLDINDTFTEYIQRTKNRIRTVSNVGRGQNNPVTDEAINCGGVINNKMENQRDHFSEFIQQAKKRIRTTSNVGKTSSLKRA